VAAVRVCVIGGVDVVVLVVLARILRVREITTVVETVTRRVPVLRRP
jgi:putative peptidoglycan lipid II flippase